MDTYNFWQDVFDTYQSLPVGLQLAWLVLPPAFVLALVALTLRYRLLSRRLGPVGRGDLVYTVYRNDFGSFDVYHHTADGTTGPDPWPDWTTPHNPPPDDPPPLLPADRDRDQPNAH